jgi:hypothetical protein
MNDWDLLRREVEALNEATLHLYSEKGYLFSRTKMDFLEDIKMRSERITKLADEKIMAAHGGILEKYRLPNT